MSVPADPTTREHDEPIEARSLAEAIENLHDAYEANRQYPPELVAEVLALIERGADEVAEFERHRYARWFRHTARNGRHLPEGLVAGMRWAAQQLDANTARFTREGTPT